MADHTSFAVIFERLVDEPDPSVIAAHRRRLARLAAEGKVAMAGPFVGGGGLVILCVDDEEEAREIVRGDPFVIHATHRYRLAKWLQDIGPPAGRQA